MAEAEGKPGAETLSEAFDQFKRDGAAWVSAEQALLQARATQTFRRLVLAAFLAGAALLAGLTATITLADMLVNLLTPSLGAVLAGLAVTIVMFAVGAILIFCIKSLLPTNMINGRALNGAKVVWSALNEPN
jgi:formate/nitrite transporter FocA (FNT family)